MTYILYNTTSSKLDTLPWKFLFSKNSLFDSECNKMLYPSSYETGSTSSVWGINMSVERERELWEYHRRIQCMNFTKDKQSQKKKQPWDHVAVKWLKYSIIIQLFTRESSHQHFIIQFMCSFVKPQISCCLSDDHLMNDHTNITTHITHTGDVSHVDISWLHCKMFLMKKCL